MKKEITEELLESLLNEGLSANQIGKQLGYSGTGINIITAVVIIQHRHNHQILDNHLNKRLYQ